ncbi:hypothetical protein [Chryseolinea lacunae]|uniref:Glycoside hydrolase family 57 N-terminal domain-containing protein n=1 Tax=Chryseolinea lacunae TaxID=2801331 RepID=A0ABS1KTH2_9BACT|nr:hypothetical protein [Chryseolinea lacunae]MBL0742740.1 hypothetical protein [Chryseolinea lacunae]
MKTLHLIGHMHKWNLDSHFKNGVGDGFIFCAYSFPYGYFDHETMNDYPMNEVLAKSMIDLQYYGKKESGNINKGKLSTYPFHPAANPDSEQQTEVYIENAIRAGIRYQISIGLNNIVIPNFYENDDLDKLIIVIKNINSWLVSNKVDGKKYYMTIPIANHTVIDASKMDKLLYSLTDIDIQYDGYYIVCEARPEHRQKISTDFKYLNNLSRFLSVLKKQKFETIYSYANWDVLIFLAVTNIDFITIASYENLRNFSIRRFLINEDGGPSKGWYFSEKILNFIKAQLIDLVRSQGGLKVIKNEKNIFSDSCLEEYYAWSNQKPDVHKNYLLSIDRLLKKVASIADLNERKKYVLSLIEDAIHAYRKLEEKKIFLTDESKNYHLETWKSFLLTK